MEIPFNIEMKKTRWRTFCHMLILHEKTPCQMAILTLSKYQKILTDIIEEKGLLYLLKWMKKYEINEITT